MLQQELHKVIHKKNKEIEEKSYEIDLLNGEIHYLNNDIGRLQEQILSHRNKSNQQSLHKEKANKLVPTKKFFVNNYLFF